MLGFRKRPLSSRRRASSRKLLARKGNALRFEPLEPRMLLAGFTAFNDVVAGPQTHEFATRFADTGGDAAGLMRDIETGEETDVLLSTFAVGVNFGGTGGNPSAGTDAYDIFGSYVDFSSAAGANSLEISGADSFTYRFENLDRGNTYEFAGSAVRGNDAYTNRWTLVTLLGAEAYTPAHSAGIGVVTNGLAENEVAIWFGANHRSNQGFVAQWLDIDPGDDGLFEVVSQQYRGSTPGVGSGTATGSKGYGINGIRLIANEPSGPPAVENTPATNIEAFAAEIGGDITATGGQAPDVTIYYGTTDGGTNPGDWDQAIDIGDQRRGFSELIVRLDQATTYYYRSFAENTIGSAWAPSSESFTTLTATAPTVVNRPAAIVGAFSAWLEGEVTDTGNDAPLVMVYYGETDGGTDPVAWDHLVEVGAESGEFATVVSGLDSMTPYYFTAYVQNAVGNGWATPSLTFTTTDLPPLQITEFMADNATTLLTRTRDNDSAPFGDQTSPDWIEITNPTDTLAVLDGYYLTDNLGNLTKWKFPAGVSIMPGDSLVVFASGKDITEPTLDSNGYLHTDFKLRDDGEDLALSDAQGNVIMAFENYPVQSQDISYGVGLDGLERFFPVPTPGGDNADDTPKAPTFNFASTTFTGSVVVELTPAFPSDTIHYTLNEIAPTANSPVYTGPLTISNTTMLRAVSVGVNGKLSQRVSETYIELGSDVLSRSSNLPLVVVETFGDGIAGKGSTFGDTFIGIFEPGDDGRTRLTDPLVLSTRGGMHVRGSSSAGFSKKQYRVEFWDENNEDQRHEVLGMPNEADWIFYGPGPYDRALLNNPLIFDLSNQIGRYAVRTKWVEMYLNSNGGQLTASDYVGIYAIMEVFESGDDRVDIEPLSTGAGGIPVSGGFAWKNDRGSAYVEPENPTSAQRSYIDGYINSLDSAANSSYFKDPDRGYAAYADVDAFIDHNILNLLPMNVDAMRLSGFYHKTAGGKLEAGPIWDFDRAFDSTDGRDNNPSTWYGGGDSTRYFNDSSRVRTWWPRMFQDPDFVQKYIDRWFELREDEFSLANVYTTIDAHAAELQEAAPRDYSRWSNSRYGNFAGEISHLKSWLTTRINWIDSQWLRKPRANVTNPVVVPGSQVSLAAPSGTVYYTLDGSDPRASGGGVAQGAIRGDVPITVNDYTKVTARVYRPNHGPTNQGYIPTGDDWSAPLDVEYFVNPLAGPGDLAVSEINYHPTDPTADELATQADELPDYKAGDFEFIELLNTSGHRLNVDGVQFADGIEFTFDNRLLDDGDHVLLVRNPEAFAVRYGAGIAVAGTFTGGLDNGGEEIMLLARNGSPLASFDYDDSGNWPGRADGKGAALILIDPAAVPTTTLQQTEYLEDGDHWRSSIALGGTPGAAAVAPLGIVVNEVLTHTDPPFVDTIELHNTNGFAVDVGGWYVSDSWGWDWDATNGNYKKYRIPTDDPARTTIPASGYLLLDENDFNPGVGTLPNDFALSAARGDDVWLMKANTAGDLTHFADHVEFGAAANGEALGRWPNGQGGLYPLLGLTLGEENRFGPRLGSVIISEVHYAPDAVTNAEDLEFIEIFNAGETSVDLTNWRVRKGIDYDFAEGTILESHATLVLVPFDLDETDKLTNFLTTYQLPGSEGILGGYRGQLGNSGERVQLQRPDEPPIDNPELIPALLADEVVYDDAAPWPIDADGAGMSLNRQAVNTWGNDATSWIAAAPSPGVVTITDLDDAYEPNNTPAAAFDPGIDWNGTPLGTIASTAMQADADWYRIAVPANGRRLIVDLTFNHTYGNLDLAVCDAAGTPVVVSQSLTNNERTDALLRPGTWYLRVDGDDSGNGYDLTWNTEYVHPGDADLSGATDLSDFNIWNAYKFTAGTSWTEGDFNGDGNTDLSDFNIWNAYKFTTAPAPSPVPVSDSELAWLLALQSQVQNGKSTAANGPTPSQRAVDLLLASYWP